MDRIRKELIEKWIELKPKTTPVIFTTINNKTVAIKDESINETGTYKAHHGWMMGLHYLQNRFPNPFIYYLGSTGNAGMADFAFADKLNDLLGEQKVTIVNFYPEHYDSKILGPDSFGRFTDGKRIRLAMEKYRSGKLIRVDFTKTYWLGKPCIDKMNELGICANKDNSLDITEGFNPTYTRVMFDFIEQIKSEYKKYKNFPTTFPKTLAIIQFGAGMLYDDSELVVKQSSLDIDQSSLDIDLCAVSTGNKDTVADKICDSSESWQRSLEDLKNKGFTFAKKSGDKIYQVTEQDILFALGQFRQLGRESEPSGAASLAHIRNLDDSVLDRYDLIATINTGNGIKSAAFDSLLNY